MFDTRLLILERCLEDKKAEREYIAGCMGITVRHFLRLLNKWEDEGYINFKPGEEPEIAMNMDVEHSLINEFINKRSSYTLQEIRAFLDLPWSSESVDTLRKLLIRFSNYKDDSDEKILIDYTYRSIHSYEPINIIDYAGFQVSSQVIECLYKINERGQISYGLIKFDEWQGDTLHLYLREGLMFSNGTEVTSDHVKSSLERLITKSNYAYLYTNIKKVEVMNKMHVALTVSGRKNIVKYTLSQLFSAIYAEGEKIVGTGPYKIESIADGTIILSVNQFYWKNKPEIKKIYLLTNENKMRKAYNRTTMNENSSFCMVAQTFMLFNPLNDRFTDDERNVFKIIAEESIRENMRGFKLDEAVGNIRAMLSDEQLKINKRLRIIADEYTEPEMKYFFKMMDELGLHYSVLRMTQQEYLSIDSSELEADLVMNQEGYFSSNPYMLVDLLTHCKFKDWYLKVDDFYDFLNEEYSDQELYNKSSELIAEIINDNLMIPLYPMCRVFFMPSDFTNLEMLPYGIIDYSKIIIDS